MPPRNTQQKAEPTPFTLALYDELMRRIEPELRLETLPTLDALYKDETPEEHAARMERYAHAFEVFDERFDAVIEQWKDQLITFRNETMTKLETKSIAEDAATVTALESSFSNA